MVQKAKPPVPPRKGGKLPGTFVRPLAERLKLAKQINDYRATHKGMRIPEVLAALGLTDKVSESNYWAWRKRLELADVTRQANRQHANGGNGQHPVVEFPLEAIPAREKPEKRGPYVSKAVSRAMVHNDEDKHIAAGLL